MSDIKLFRIAGRVARELDGTALDLERPLQALIEANLGSLLGMRVVASEYSTGKTHAGRIDTLALDENNAPVIVEYKRSSHENIINQGLFYLDWLMDHQAEFKLLVLEKYGRTAADAIEWDGPRLVCIAADFTRYDTHAVQQMNRNIELVRYRMFSQELLLLELVNAVAATPKPARKKVKGGVTGGTDKTVTEWLVDMDASVRSLFQSLEGYLLSLGDDVQRKDLKLYIAYKRLRNFATVCFQRRNLLVYLHVDPGQVAPVGGLTRDVRAIGHWGTGDLELTLRDPTDLERAKPLLLRAYEGRSIAG